jgi:glycosyltransferase involved in cell wall biosynthesis
MNLLFTRFPLESRLGGAERQTISLMEGLRKKGHDVRFLGSCPVLYEESAKIQIPNIKLDVGKPPVTKWGAISFLWRRKEMQQKLIKAMAQQKEQHDTAFFMLSLTEKLLLTQWAHDHGIKVFWIEHDRIGRWLKWNPWLPMLRRLSSLATTVAVSDMSRKMYIDLGWKPENVIAIPNGINVEKFSGRKEEDRWQMPDDASFSVTLRLGCIARLTKDKGVDLLIEAVRDLPDVSLTIVGMGREEPAVRRAAEQVNELTSKRVTFLSSVVSTLDFFQNIDVLVLPSREHDPFGLVVAEAMAAGIPVICTEACGIASHLSRDEAVIVPANDAAALHEAIVLLTQDEALREHLAQQGPVIARERFAEERMIEAYAELLS